MSSRRGRRRRERERAKRPPHRHALGALQRVGLVGGGALLVAAGVALLIAGGPGTAARLGRLAGILIIIGLVAFAVAAIGHV